MASSTPGPTASPPPFESPITKSYPESAGNGLTLTDESALSKLLVRADDDTAAAQQLGVGFGASRTQDGVLICGQRPTEWLLVGDGASVAALAATLDRTGHVSTIDHTHSRAMFRISGADSGRVLEKICSIDWDDRMTPNGAVVSASVAKVTCDIVRCDVPGSGLPDSSSADVRSYRLACDRSFAQYLFDAVLDAGTEFGIGVQLSGSASTEV